MHPGTAGCTRFRAGRAGDQHDRTSPAGITARWTATRCAAATVPCRARNCRYPNGYRPACRRSRFTAGSIARIFTGAPIPEGADAVVMQEECTAIDGGAVQIGVAVPPVPISAGAARDITAGGEVVSPVPACSRSTSGRGGGRGRAAARVPQAARRPVRQRRRSW